MSFTLVTYKTVRDEDERRLVLDRTEHGPYATREEAGRAWWRWICVESAAGREDWASRAILEIKNEPA